MPKQLVRICPSDRFCRVQNLPTSSVELISPITELYFRQILSTDFINRFYLDVIRRGLRVVLRISSYEYSCDYLDIHGKSRHFQGGSTHYTSHILRARRLLFLTVVFVGLKGDCKHFETGWDPTMA